MVDGVMPLGRRFRGPCRKPLCFEEAWKLPAADCVHHKIDRPDARVAEVLDEILDLFIDLDATEGPNSTSPSSTPMPVRAGDTGSETAGRIWQPLWPI